MKLTEDILHFVWKHALFDSIELMTNDGAEISLIKRGSYNYNDGPDFSDARIRIGDTQWAGQVEIHVRSSDWYLHKHENDERYKNVILHVVYFHDREVYVNDQKLPVLSLKNRVKPFLFSKYKELIDNRSAISCKNNIASVSRPVIISQIERSLIERLTRKSDEVFQFLDKCKGDWEEVTFHLLAHSLLGKINKEPFEWMFAERTIHSLNLFGESRFKLEALFLGMAGLLEGVNEEDEYIQLLRSEFIHLKNKFGLVCIEKATWKYGRLRPPQFPDSKLAQLAAIIAAKDSLFRKLINTPDYPALKRFLLVETGEYWHSHYRLGKPSVKGTSGISNQQADLIIINCFLPILFAYGKYQMDEDIQSKAINLFMSVSPEKNHITRKWMGCGLRPETAFDSQGLVELYNNLCIQKKCLTCNIGTSLLGHDSKN